MTKEDTEQFDHEERLHAKFSPSGADRWLHCPGSIPLQDLTPDKYKITNKWAIAGTQAHKVLEILMHGENIGGFPAEYQHYATTTLQWIKLRFDRWKEYKKVSEMRFYAGEFFGLDDDLLHGSSDLTMYSIEEKRLIICDYKYGTKKVKAKQNYQLMIYAIGAYMDLFLRNPEATEFTKKNDIAKLNITLCVLQPRVSNGMETWDANFRSKETIDWFKTFISGVKQAHKEVDELEEILYEDVDLDEELTEERVNYIIENYVAEDDYFQYGSWCYWCCAKSLCPKWVDERLDAFEDEAEDLSMGNEKHVGYGTFLA